MFVTLPNHLLFEKNKYIIGTPKELIHKIQNIWYNNVFMRRYVHERRTHHSEIVFFHLIFCLSDLGK